VSGRWIRIFVLTAVIGILVVGGWWFYMMAEAESTAVMPLHVTGDVEEVLTIRDPGDDRFDPEQIALRDATAHAVSLEAVIAAASPAAADYDVLLVGADGRSALLDGADLASGRIALTGDYGWEARMEDHPPASNIKNLDRIVVISRGAPPGETISIVAPGKNLAHFTPGQLYESGLQQRWMEVGRSSVSKEDRTFETVALKRRKAVDLEKLVDVGPGEQVWAVGELGEVKAVNGNDVLYLDGNTLVLSCADGNVRIDRLRGLIIDPPGRMITDVRDDAERLLRQDEPVLLVLIDGLGWHQFEYATEEGLSPVLSSLPRPDCAMVAYPPVTPVNVAASLTGETPDVTGIHDRRVRRANVPTIFSFARDAGMKATAIVGPMQGVELEIDPVLCTDAAGTGSTDDDILRAALERVGEGYDLMLVHFKDVDRAGHEHGDTAPETLRQIARIDGYVGQLLREWEGHVVIFSDHGMHETVDGGDHGMFLAEDLFVPYWKIDWRDRVE